MLDPALPSPADEGEAIVGICWSRPGVAAPFAGASVQSLLDPTKSASVKARWVGLVSVTSFSFVAAVGLSCPSSPGLEILVELSWEKATLPECCCDLHAGGGVCCFQEVKVL